MARWRNHILLKVITLAITSFNSLCLISLLFISALRKVIPEQKYFAKP